MFLPLVPTTAFLLLAAACFTRSSDRLYKWLMYHPILGSYIRNYREHHAITVRAKVMSLGVLWVGIGATALFAVDALWLRLLLLAIACGVTLHLLSLKTMPGGSPGEPQESLTSAD